MDLATLVVRLAGDATKYQETLNKAEGETQGFVSRMTSGLASIGSTVVTGAIWAAGAAFVGLGFLINSSVQEAISAEEIMAQLNSTLSNTSSITGVTSDMVTELADHYASLTRFEDDMVVAGGEVLARFQQINSEAFPDALRLSLDLATKWGTDVPSAATILGKALADPGEGLMKLKSAGVVFTDAQDEMIAKMVEMGDIAGAQALILQVVNETVGGAAEAAGKTAAGTWERLKNTWGNALELIGTGLLPALVQLGETLSTWLANPAVQAGIENFAQGIADFAMTVVTNLPTVIDWFQRAFGWLQENEGVVVAALAGIGAAVITFAVSAGAAIWAAVAPLLPAIAVMLLVAAITYVVYQAWTNNWGGIQQKTANVIAFIQGVIQSGLQFIENLTSGKMGAVSQIFNSTFTFIQTYIQNFVAMWRAIFAAFAAAARGDWQAFGENMRVAFDTGLRTIVMLIQTSWSNIQVAISALARNIMGYFSNIDWGQVGRNITQGIANGITSGVAWIVSAARNAANAALQAAKGFLGIKSPSKVAQDQLGEPIGQGQGLGWINSLLGMVPRIKQTVGNVVDSVAGGSMASSQLSPAMATAGIASNGNGRSGNFSFTVNHSPTLSLGDRYEVEQVFKPMLLDWLRELGVEVNK